MGRNLAGLPLKPEEMNLFLLGMNGSSEREAQLQLLERKRKEVEELIDKVKEEIREKGKVAVGLGTLGGLLLIVILL